MRQIGPYQIEGVIGAGGMGVVYKGRHVTLGRLAAIKTLLPDKAGDAALRARFIAEGKAQALLEHDGIVKVYDAFTDGGELFIAMEYVEGETLAKTLEKLPHHRMPLEEVLEISTQFLTALHYVHGQKIIHRDIKPLNVMLCHGRVKLMDWGLAIVDGAPRFTVTNRVPGTLPYMSPEQIEGKPLDARTDIYSWGVVLHQMLAGALPFAEQGIYARWLGPPELREFVPDLPAGVSDAVKMALQADPAKRFASAVELRDALREGALGFLDVLPHDSDATVPYTVPDAIVETQPPVSQDPSISRRWVWIAIAACLVAMVYVTVSLWNRQPAFDFRPPQQRGSSSNGTDRIVIDFAAPLPAVLKSRKQPQEAPKQQPPVVDDRAATQRAADDATRIEIEQLRARIALALKRADADVRNNSFASAREQVAQAERWEQQSAGLWQERDAIERMRGRINEAEELERVHRQQEAMWSSRIADVESDLRKERWPEAERFAKNIIDSADAPEPVRARASELLQQAKDGRAAIFKETEVGNTQNTIVRKPPSPPRKNR